MRVRRSVARGFRWVASRICPSEPQTVEVSISACGPESVRRLLEENDGNPFEEAARRAMQEHDRVGDDE